MSEQEYFEMIADKTAELCSVACFLGAHLSGADDATAVGFETFGRNLGIAFQIVDDVLDLVGQPAQVGKTLGTDIAHRKPTLPVIHCLSELNVVERVKLVEMLNQGDTTVADVIPLLISTKSIEYARSVAMAHCNRATEFASTLSPSEYSLALQNMAQFVLQRSH